VLVNESSSVIGGRPPISQSDHSSGEDTVLMIDGDFTQMLHGEGISDVRVWFELAIESPARYAQEVVSDRQRPSLSASFQCSLACIAPPTQDAAEDLAISA